MQWRFDTINQLSVTPTKSRSVTPRQTPRSQSQRSPIRSTPTGRFNVGEQYQSPSSSYAQENAFPFPSFPRLRKRECEAEASREEEEMNRPDPYRDTQVCALDDNPPRFPSDDLADYDALMMDADEF